MERQFTVDEANSMLPLVRRIVDDIVRTHAKWEEAVREFEVVGANRRAGEPDDRADELERQIQRLAKDIRGFATELDELGVQCKGYELGLVDFPGEIDGEPAFLCWRLGEPAVSFWHPRDAGFAGRQPLAPQHAGNPGH
ncbi:MAG: DUF2203 domain-containing protein [Gemmatimonadaceae bacterium]